MNNTNIRLLIPLLFVFACGQRSQQKPDKEIVLKRGAELFAKYGCAVCHSLDGKVIYGPPLNEIFMKNIKVVRQGQEVNLTADREYLKKAIREPRFEKVFDYQNKEMPLSNFTEEETDILVEYIVILNEKNKHDN